MANSIVVRRDMPYGTNSLFDAVGYVMDHNRNRASELRQVIASTVANDPEKYSEAFLGKTNKEYCEWILNAGERGGGIELAILSDHYGREIASYDILSTRCDLYRQDKNFGERVMLIHEGFQYHALAMSYRDIANIRLQCVVCHARVFRQREAITHAGETGHTNFQEDKGRRRWNSR